MKLLVCASALLLLASCSTMHLRLESQYKSPKGDGKVVYEKSYDLASFPWICGATAIFYGGGCWAYVMMPMVPQEGKFTEDAKAELRKKLEADEVTLVEPEVTRTSWSQKETKLELSQ